MYTTILFFVNWWFKYALKTIRVMQEKEERYIDEE